MTCRNKTLGIFICLLICASAWAIDGPDSDSLGFSITAGDLVLNSAVEMTRTSMDCSHLVHYLYYQSGQTYVYADSRKLYEGVTAFQRVAQPQPGDLIVWQGHVGIVVDPEQHSFVSALRSGVKVAFYDSRYWKRKGEPRFFHFITAIVSNQND